MIESLLKAIKAKIDTDSGVTGLYTAIGGRYYLSRGLHRETFPYLVYEVISEAPLGDLSTEIVERVRVQFSTYDSSDGQSPVTCAQVQKKVRALFDGVRLTLTGGYGEARMIRDGGTGPIRVDEAWQATTDYLAVFAVS